MPRWIFSLALLALASMQYRLWIGPGGTADANDLAARVAQQSQINAQARERNRRLETQVRQLDSSLDAIEYHARAELGLIKPGETFFLVVH